MTSDLLAYLIAQADKLNLDWQVTSSKSGSPMLYRKWTGDTTAVFALVEKDSGDVVDNLVFFTEDVDKQYYRKVTQDSDELMSILKEFSK